MKYFIKTYGCQMNVHESEKIGGILKAKGFSSSEQIADSDIIIFNTCCIRENAENKAFGNIGAIKSLKKKNKDLIVAVVGCMTQQEGLADKLKLKFPYIDIILGTHNLMRLGEKLDTVLNSRQSKKCHDCEGIEIWKEYKPFDEGDIAPERFKGYGAWLNIMYGCNNFCSYCIVPYVRGRERSRPFQEIKHEFEGLVKSGFKEITLLGQNVNSYGTDSPNHMRFSELLKELAKTSGEYRIKFMTSHPKDFSEDIINVMKGTDRIAKQIHLPLQSGSEKILHEMNRKYTPKNYLEKIEAIKNALPDAGLSSDIMVGFPGETEEDFLKTIDLVEKVRFDNLYMFEYSPRSGTLASKMENQVLSEEKTSRIKRLIELQRKIGNIKSREEIGKTVRVLADKIENGRFVGTTDAGRLTFFNAENVDLGTFVKVKITSSKGGKLFGEISK